jgi:hypothetical protein
LVSFIFDEVRVLKVSGTGEWMLADGFDTLVIVIEEVSKAHVIPVDTVTTINKFEIEGSSHKALMNRIS